MKKELILQSAQEIIFKSGLSHLLMDEVARHCGVSKKTIYELFGNKEELVEALTRSFLTGERNEFYREMGSSRNYEEKISFIMRYFFKMIALIPYENLIYLKKRHLSNYDRIINYKEEIFRVFEELLHEGKEKDEIYQDLDVSMYLRLLEAQLNYIHINHRNFSQEGTMNAWKDQIVLSFKRSILKPS